MNVFVIFVVVIVQERSFECHVKCRTDLVKTESQMEQKNQQLHRTYWVLHKRQLHPIQRMLGAMLFLVFLLLLLLLLLATRLHFQTKFVLGNERENIILGTKAPSKANK
jgi:hypothetical protein